MLNMKRKKIQNYNSVAVIKSNRIIEAKYRLNARAQKFILFMAAMINPSDQDFKYLRVKIKDIEPIFNTEQKKWGSIYQIVKDVLLSLNNHPLKITQPDGSHLIINWIASAEIREGSGMVEFEFSEKLRPYLVQLKSHFTKYKLQNILQLKSGFSIRLYELLKARQFIGKAEYEVNELKEILGLGDKYAVYYDFKRRVLLVAQEELRAHSDIYFEFKEKRIDRKVAILNFYIHENVEVVKKMEETDDLPKVDTPLVDELVNLGFSRLKAIELLQLGFDVLVDEHVKFSVKEAYPNPEEYFKEKIDLTTFEIKRGKVHHPSGFFLKAIQEDYQSLDFKNSQKKIVKQLQEQAQTDLKNQYNQLYETQKKIYFQQQQHVINKILETDVELFKRLLTENKVSREEYLQSPMVKGKINALVMRAYPTEFDSLKTLEENIVQLKKQMEKF